MDQNQGEQFLFPETAFNAELHQQKLIDMLLEHDKRDDLCRENPELNHLDGTLAGQQVMYLQAKPEVLLEFFKQTGCAYDTVGITDKGKKVPHYSPKEQQDKVLLLQTVRRSANRYINDNLNHRFPNQKLVGVQYFFDTPTPEAHLLYEFASEATTTTSPSPNKLSSKNHKENEEDINSPLSTSAYSLGNQRRLIQRQQEAVNGDDNKQEEPDVPIKTHPVIDENLQRQRQHQAEQQQADAVNDDDDDDYNKKNRDRRNQQRRTKQRLTQEQEAEIIRERCLAHEAKVNEELKHPKPGSFNKPSSNKPEPDNGPSM